MLMKRSKNGEEVQDAVTKLETKYRVHRRRDWDDQEKDGEISGGCDGFLSLICEEHYFCNGKLWH